MKVYGEAGLYAETYADKKASGTQYNFYWVIPYHKNSAGKLVAGYKGTYVYGKAK